MFVRSVRRAAGGVWRFYRLDYLVGMVERIFGRLSCLVGNMEGYFWERVGGFNRRGFLGKGGW